MPKSSVVRSDAPRLSVSEPRPISRSAVKAVKETPSRAQYVSVALKQAHAKYSAKYAKAAQKKKQV